MESAKRGVAPRGGADRKLVESQEKLHQMELDRDQKQLQGSEETPAKAEVPAWGAPGVLRALVPSPHLSRLSRVGLPAWKAFPSLSCH